MTLQELVLKCEFNNATTVEEHTICKKAWLLWFDEPLRPDDWGPVRRHFVLAVLQLLVEKNFMLDALRSG